MFVKRWFLLGILLLCGCHSVSIPDTFSYRHFKAGEFTLAGWQKELSPHDFVKIYIEGDGAAFDAYGQPTSDPTPRGILMREIAFGDSHDNVLYLARPCQFVRDEKCLQKYWTTARFAPEVVEAMSRVISKVSHGRPVVLVGFSGGAQIAGLVAVLHPNLKVRQIITIGGNLDHSAWTAYHHLPALTQSLNLADYKEAFQKIRQTHYVGEKDDIIPPFLIREFAAQETIVDVKGAQHSQGWDAIYPFVRFAD
ncbi:MAG: alpha/beta hydrolase [Alphaproteobacteria bacterium]|nr:alpha/beta hydrolase [Alphaproteobacteria bacterium]